jgi:hypothetical protein
MRVEFPLRVWPLAILVCNFHFKRRKVVQIPSSRIYWWLEGWWEPRSAVYAFYIREAFPLYLDTYKCSLVLNQAPACIRIILEDRMTLWLDNTAFCWKKVTANCPKDEIPIAVAHSNYGIEYESSWKQSTQRPFDDHVLWYRSVYFHIVDSKAFNNARHVEFFKHIKCFSDMFIRRTVHDYSWSFDRGCEAALISLISTLNSIVHR